MRTNRHISILILLCLFLGASSAAVGQSLDYYKLSGLDYGIQQKQDSAISTFRSGMKSYPMDSELPYLLAQAKLASAEGVEKWEKVRDEVKSILKHAIEIDPTYADPLRMLIDIHNRNDAPDSSLLLINSSLKIITDSAVRFDLYLDAYEAKTLQMDFTNLYVELQKAESMKLISRRYFEFKGEFFLRQNDYEKASEAYQSAIAHGYTSHTIFHNLAFCLQNLKKFNMALRIYDRLIFDNPNDAYAWNNRGFTKFNLGKLSEALQDIVQSLELDPDNGYAYYYLALIFFEKKEKEKACSYLDMAIEKGYTDIHGGTVEELKAKKCK